MRAALLALPLLLPAAASAEVYTWVDEDGVTHIADDPAALPEGARAGRAGLGELWRDGVVAPGASAEEGTPRGVEGDRVARLLAGAVADLRRGETARAAAALRSVLRLDPKSADAHWHLAQLDRSRGRYASSEVHLEAFLALAGDDDAARRARARQQLEQLADERRLADAERLAGEAVFVGARHPHFRVLYDAELARPGADYASTVLGFLEQAHVDVGERLGAVPSEPLGVMFYGKAAYLRAHRHRFSFQTVGFFDGRIHVVSAAHPAGELRALLFHEYTHAVFREQTGGDRPFWLNEGMAELAERASRGRPGLTLSERSLLRRRIDADDWIPLRRLAPSFGGLADGDARVAYLASASAAAWIEQHTGRAERGRLLARLGEGADEDEALRETLGLGTDELDEAVRRWIRAEFPARPDLRAR